MQSESSRIVRDSIDRAELATRAEQQFGDMIKGVVDVTRGIMVIGGELHSDDEATLLEDGSNQSDLWGINLYPGESPEHWIEYDSLINVRRRKTTAPALSRIRRCASPFATSSNRW